MEDDRERRFTTVFVTCHARLTTYARRRVHKQETQYVVAAAFVAAWRHLDDVADDPIPWLYRAAFFETAAQRRKDRRGRRFQRWRCLSAVSTRQR